MDLFRGLIKTPRARPREGLRGRRRFIIRPSVRLSGELGQDLVQPLRRVLDGHGVPPGDFERQFAAGARSVCPIGAQQREFDFVENRLNAR